MRGQDVDIITLLQILRHPRYLPGMSEKKTKKQDEPSKERFGSRPQSKFQVKPSELGSRCWSEQRGSERLQDSDQEENNVGERNVGSKFRRVTNIL